MIDCEETDGKWEDPHRRDTNEEGIWITTLSWSKNEISVNPISFVSPQVVNNFNVISKDICDIKTNENLKKMYSSTLIVGKLGRNELRGVFPKI
jgi:hypothetical protein